VLIGESSSTCRAGFTATTQAGYQRWTATFAALDGKRNPYFRSVPWGSFFAAEMGARRPLCGDRSPGYTSSDGRLPAHFGFFESENDPEAVRALFDRVGAWCAQRGATDLRGPSIPITTQNWVFRSTVLIRLPRSSRPIISRTIDLYGGIRIRVEKVLAHGPQFGHSPMAQRAPFASRECSRPSHPTGGHARPRCELDRIREIYNEASPTTAISFLFPKKSIGIRPADSPSSHVRN